MSKGPSTQVVRFVVAATLTAQHLHRHRCVVPVRCSHQRGIEGARSWYWAPGAGRQPCRLKPHSAGAGDPRRSVVRYKNFVVSYEEGGRRYLTRNGTGPQIKKDNDVTCEI